MTISETEHRPVIQRRLTASLAVLSCVMLLFVAPARSDDFSPAVPRTCLQAAKEARASFHRGDYREAERIYNVLSAAIPNNPYVLSNLGVVRFRLGKLKLAARALERCILLSPNNSFSYSTLAVIYFKQARLDDAERAAVRAIALNPENAGAHSCLAFVLLRRGEYGRSAEEQRKARELDRSRP